MKEPIQSQVNARKEHSERLTRRICELLECTPAQYAQFQYQSGLRYLKNYLCDQSAADMLSRSRVFWNWWRNHWTNRDESFLCLHEKIPFRDRDTRLQLFLEYNNGKELASCIHPNSVVLDESYATMLTDVLGDSIDKTIKFNP